MPQGAEQATVLRVRSISQPVWRWLAEGPTNGQVLAAFDRTCLLSSEGGRLIALVLPQIGDGPFNLVLEGQPGCFASLQAGTPASLGKARIRAGTLEVLLQGPLVWNPHPAWDTLRARREHIVEQTPLLLRLGRRHAGRASLLQLLSGASHPPGTSQDSLPNAVAGRAREGITTLREGLVGDPEALQRGAARLAGLGIGLTPAGDDFLCGLMLWAWLTHPCPRHPCQIIIEAARNRTTTLSAAFLQAAAMGECSAAWHQLLTALDGGTEDQVETAVQAVLASGSTSGADTLAGFLCMAAVRNT